MSETIHERPGVYSSYDASSAVSARTATGVIGVAALAAAGTANAVVTLTSLNAGLAAFGADTTGTHMAELLRILYRNGAGTVKAVRVASTGAVGDYEAAFAALAAVEDITVVVCDSAALNVQQTLRESVESASEARRERIAVIGGGSGETAAQLVERAEEINSERVALVGPEAKNENGTTLGGYCAAAALAAALAAQGDVSIPINGTALAGFGGLSAQWSDTEIDTLVRGGVTPLECVGGVVSPVRGITTRTETDDAPDATWRELTTVRIVDDVIPAIRASLRARFAHSKNTAQTRSAIRSQVIVALEGKLAEEKIDSYGAVNVCVCTDDPTAAAVEFDFAVAHGLNRVYLTAHITV